MGIRKIPEVFEFTCDVCGAKHLQENADGRVTFKRRPPKWGILELVRAAEDFQGQEAADASLERVLCGSCLAAISAAINEETKSIRRQTGGTEE